jgi:hypothetical protein
VQSNTPPLGWPAGLIVPAIPATPFPLQVPVSPSAPIPRRKIESMRDILAPLTGKHKVSLCLFDIALPVDRSLHGDLFDAIRERCVPSLPSELYPHVHTMNWDANDLKMSIEIDCTHTNKESLIKFAEDIKLFAAGIGSNMQHQLPKFWFPFTGDVQLQSDPMFFKRVPLNVGCDEWNRVLENMGTIGYPMAKKLERVQNPYLWKMFQVQCATFRDTMQSVTGDNLRYLWHGFRSTDPDELCASGIDFRHSAGGSWGRGTYLAKDADVSVGYSVKSSLGDYRMFLCRVALGRSFNMPIANGNLVKAPQGHHSVQGCLGGKEVHIVYQSYQVYPAYLVTFRFQ